MRELTFTEAYQNNDLLVNEDEIMLVRQLASGRYNIARLVPPTKSTMKPHIKLHISDVSKRLSELSDASSMLGIAIGITKNNEIIKVIVPEDGRLRILANATKMPFDQVRRLVAHTHLKTWLEHD